MTNRALTYLILFGLAAMGAAPKGSNAQEVASDTIRVYVRLTPPPAELCLAVATPASPQSGHVAISYVLSCDAALTASLAVRYSTDGGAAWTTATMGAGGDGLRDLATSPTGIRHTYRWNSLADIGCATTVSARLRLEACAASCGATSATTGAFLIDNTTHTLVMAYLKDPSVLPRAAAAILDVNGDGKIDVADVVTLTQKGLLHSSQSQAVRQQDRHR